MRLVVSEGEIDEPQGRRKEKQVQGLFHIEICLGKDEAGKFRRGKWERFIRYK
jgi:hypothetical protein